MGRREARETAMTLLYSFEFHKEDPEIQMEFFKVSDEIKPFHEKDVEYIENVTSGVLKNIDVIDDLITKYSRGWAFNRIPKTDISVLRLCIYEMLYRNDIPSNVSINEAVELAKKYGHEESSSFVNGILGSIFKNLEEHKQ
jgi:N utilization substance protein B